MDTFLTVDEVGIALVTHDLVVFDFVSAGLLRVTPEGVPKAHVDLLLALLAASRD